VLAAGDDRFLSFDAADDRTFLVTLSAYQSSGLRSRDETVASATATRRRLWHRSGRTAEAVAGDLALTSHGRRGSDLVGLDASNGKRRWGLAGRYKSPELLHSAGSRAVVARTADGMVVLDMATGRELARTNVRPTECGGEGELLIICRVGPISDDRPPSHMPSPSSSAADKRRSTNFCEPSTCSNTEDRGRISSRAGSRRRLSGMSYWTAPARRSPRISRAT
jgi:hypothetical protein